MSTKELRRGEALSRVKRGELKLTEAAQLLDISYRQTKRIWKRYRVGGAKQLVHGNVGRKSNRAKPELRKRAIESRPQALLRRRCHALRADARRRTSRAGSQPAGRLGNATALDAGRRPVERTGTAGNRGVGAFCGSWARAPRPTAERRHPLLTRPRRGPLGRTEMIPPSTSRKT